MATEGARGDYTCIVCGEPATFAMSSECNWCDGRYHLNQRNDVEGKDCGAVWIDEQYLALQFACNNCLAANGLMPPGAPPEQRAAKPAARRRYRRRE
jgi:hypothetical protein